MSLSVKQGVAKRVLDKQLEDLEKENQTRQLIHQKDVLDVKRQLKVKDDGQDGQAVGRKSVKNDLPPVTLYNKSRANQLGRSHQAESRLDQHRHSVDLADIDNFRPHMNKEEKGGESVVSQMQSILNQTKVRSTKTSDEMWMEQFQERYPMAAAKAERALLSLDVTDAGKKGTEKDKSPKLARKSDLKSFETLFSKDNKKVVSFEGGDNIIRRAGKDSKQTENAEPGTENFSVGDNDGAWRSARKCRYLRGYDPPEMVLPAGDNTKFVFGRDFNQALDERRKHSVSE